MIDQLGSKCGHQIRCRVGISVEGAQCLVVGIQTGRVVVTKGRKGDTTPTGGTTSWRHAGHRSTGSTSSHLVDGKVGCPIVCSLLDACLRVVGGEMETPHRGDLL